MKRILLLVLVAALCEGCLGEKTPVTDPTLLAQAAAVAANKKIKKVFIIAAEPVAQGSHP